MEWKYTAEGGLIEKMTRDCTSQGELNKFSKGRQGRSKSVNSILRTKSDYNIIKMSLGGLEARTSNPQHPFKNFEIRDAVSVKMRNSARQAQHRNARYKKRLKTVQAEKYIDIKRRLLNIICLILFARAI